MTRPSGIPKFGWIARPKGASVHPPHPLLAGIRRPRKSGRMKRPEQALQIAVARYLAATLPRPPIGPEWFSIENGFKRTKAEAGIGKAMGRKAGVPDLCLVWKGRAIFIELKAPGSGKLTPIQTAMHQRLTMVGAVVATCRSLDEVADFLSTTGIPTLDTSMKAKRVA